MEIVLGSKVRCKVSGFTGIATSRVQYLNGCIQYGITTKVGKDNDVKVIYIDVGQLVVVDKGISIQIDKKEKPGGYRQDHPNY